ncbi:hypothetical protein LB533_20610 [Mesorhizobium sp. BR1-1-13]|uniref:hypothetical protein n=1 Tax=Mesorhizobium sp. BR1-1-13 TaxID=2876656 RepID=UPI001CD06427|nr:hypothetical protein [Mesorhizobium sp. BR1-1-13]MBZ9943492.1 hypothetical protein [Mesorhizobium sp. BR1-1-13]
MANIEQIERELRSQGIGLTLVANVKLNAILDELARLRGVEKRAVEVDVERVARAITEARSRIPHEWYTLEDQRTVASAAIAALSARAATQ